MTATKTKPKVPRLSREKAREMLKKIGACAPARCWFTRSGLSPQKAWEQCEKACWMVWLLNEFTDSIPSERARWDRVSNASWNARFKEFKRQEKKGASYEDAIESASKVQAAYIRKHYPIVPIPKMEKAK